MTDDCEYQIEPGMEWEVDLFKPEDAVKVTKLFLSVYGKKYPVKTFTDPDILIKENMAGRTISSVARTGTGDIVGHNALFNSIPYKRIYETGAGVVHKNYRGGKGIFTKLVSHGYKVGKEKFNMQGAFGESVCNHVFSQKMTRKLGNITMAVEVDLMPAEAYIKEGSATGRVASLLDFKTFMPKPHVVYIPENYKDFVSFIYSRFDDKREIKISQELLPSTENTKIDVQYFPFAQVARLAVSQSGGDFTKFFAKEEEKVLNQGATIIQAWVNMGQPWCGSVINILRNKGYFTGGVLPRWFDTDGFLMIKILHRPHWDDMKIYFDHAKKIVEFVKKDWETIKQI